MTPARDTGRPTRLRHKLTWSISIVVFLAVVGVAPAALGQYPDPTLLGDIAAVQPGSRLIRMRDSVNVTAQQLFPLYKQKFGLGESDQMVHIGSKTDTLGMTSHWFRQFHNGIEVMGGEYTVREYGQRCVEAIGIIKPGLAVSPMPALTEAEALQSALDTLGATTYMWENPLNDSVLQDNLDDPSATYYPSGELWVAVARHAQYDTNDIYDPAEYRLTYRFDIAAQEPTWSVRVYVDANTGVIVRKINRIETWDEMGTAFTRYDGEKYITADRQLIGPYRLRESGRGSGIRTFDANQQHDFSAAVDFTDDDNIWPATTNLDDAAWQAHFALEVAWEYYNTIHGRAGFNGSGKRVNAYVHYDESGGTGWWDNAAWWSGYNVLCFGDGNGSTVDPHTARDVVAHEFTHGVQAYTIPYVYEDESGAIKEAVADMFASMIEDWSSGFYPLIHDPYCWLLGEDYHPAGQATRDLMDPTNDARPDAYRHPVYWYTGSGDNGGVHYNNGVGNRWFYLLSDGGSGTNVFGDSYDLAGIGIEKAANIVYYVLDHKLGSTEGGYWDFYCATTTAAEWLYGGECTAEAQAVVHAWYAVALWFYRVLENVDFTPSIGAWGEHASYSGLRVGPNVTVRPTVHLVTTSTIEVRLVDGFWAQDGAEFKASIECVP